MLSSQKTNTILFICFENYPFTGPSTNIIKNMCVDGGLAEKIDTHILTIKNFSHYNTKEIIDNVTIHRLFLPEFVAVNDFYTRNKKNFLHDFYFYIKKIKSKIAQRFIKSEFLLNRNIIKCLSSSLDGLEIKDIDVIIPISGIFDATDLALKLKKRYKNKVLIIQVDPCVSNITFHAESLHNRQEFEYKMLSEADGILALPEQYYEYQLMLKDSIIKNKIKKIQIPNVIPDISKKYKIIKLDDCAINCVFAGTVNYDIRNPDYMLQLFNALNNHNIKFFLVGKYAQSIHKKITSTKHTFALGRRNLTETKSILNGADFLVSLGNSVSNLVPSKIFEYISFGKPIIHIRKLDNDPSIEYLNKYPLWIDLFEGDSIDVNVTKLEDFIIKNKGKYVDKDYIMTTYLEYTPEYCANQLYQAIVEVTHSDVEARKAVE